MEVMTLFDCLVSLFSGEKSDSGEISLPAHFELSPVKRAILTHPFTLPIITQSRFRRGNHFVRIRAPERCVAISSEESKTDNH